MGICLDTEKSGNDTAIPWIRRNNSIASENSMSATMDRTEVSKAKIGNLSGINFSVPRRPVLFLLGGPGSGKIYHCQQLAARIPGVVHLNMSDLLLQHAGRHGIRDAEGVPAAALVGVVMLEINMSPEANIFLVSGYPRHMEDLMEYTQRIVRIDGAILVDWKERSLRRQIEYGAQLGEIDLDIAKRELRLFEKKVLPVCQYLSTKRLLKVVDGERHPNEVYEDVLRTCEVMLGHKLDENSPSPQPRSTGSGDPQQSPAVLLPARPQRVLVREDNQGAGASDWIGPVVFVVGGPGSNKSQLCESVAPLFPGWVHIPLGRILRMLAEVRGSVPPAYERQSFLKHPLTPDSLIAMHGLISRGEMVSHDVCLHVLVCSMLQFPEAEGFIVDGYPRDEVQAQEFEEKFNEPVNVVLVDCSELELGRNLGRRHGRPDDSPQASRRRLQLYQTLTLPVLKELDDAGKLICIDGDSDEDNIMRELKRNIHLEMQRLQRDNTEWAFVHLNEGDGRGGRPREPNSRQPGAAGSRTLSPTDSVEMQLGKMSIKPDHDNRAGDPVFNINRKNEDLQRNKSKIGNKEYQHGDARKLHNGAMIIANVANDLSVA